MGRNPILTEAQKQSVVELFQAGHTKISIAADFGVDRGIIDRLIFKWKKEIFMAGIEETTARPDAIPSNTREKLRKCLVCGKEFRSAHAGNRICSRSICVHKTQTIHPLCL